MYFKLGKLSAKRGGFLIAFLVGLGIIVSFFLLTFYLVFLQTWLFDNMTFRYPHLSIDAYRIGAIILLFSISYFLGISIFILSFGNSKQKGRFLNPKNRVMFNQTVLKGKVFNIVKVILEFGFLMLLFFSVIDNCSFFNGDNFLKIFIIIWIIYVLFDVYSSLKNFLKIRAVDTLKIMVLFFIVTIPLSIWVNQIWNFGAEMAIENNEVFQKNIHLPVVKMVGYEELMEIGSPNRITLIFVDSTENEKKFGKKLMDIKDLDKGEIEMMKKQWEYFLFIDESVPIQRFYETNYSLALAGAKHVHLVYRHENDINPFWHYYNKFIFEKSILDISSPNISDDLGHDMVLNTISESIFISRDSVLYNKQSVREDQLLDSIIKALSTKKRIKVAFDSSANYGDYIMFKAIYLAAGNMARNNLSMELYYKQFMDLEYIEARNIRDEIPLLLMDESELKYFRKRYLESNI